jgi:hypothetical protein
MVALDGNAIAGTLMAAFGTEMTTASSTCICEGRARSPGADTAAAW